jgi:hypothetical protein
MTDTQLDQIPGLRDIPSFGTLMDNLQKTINNAWNIGNRIHQPSIDKWLENFTGKALCRTDKSDIESAAEREKQIALFLLCNFVYYNEDEIKHLVRAMLDRYAHSVFSQEGKTTVTDTDYTDLIGTTQFTFLGNISESSSYLLYHFRQENDLSKQCFAESARTKNIVFIDDFSITGSQAKQYICNKMKEPTWDSSKRIYVLLMIATEDAVNEIEKINSVTVLPCIVLDEKSKAFSSSSIVFSGYYSKWADEAKLLCEHYGNNLVAVDNNGMTALGFGGCGYMFGAYYNIPDNTLPIFWSSQNNWNYLFKRYDKKYGVSGSNLGGRYV